MLPKTIRTSDLPRAQETLGAPPYEPEILTRRAAILRVIPQIAALRRKGYPMAAIAAKLEAQGLAVSPVALQKALREHRTKTSSKRPADMPGCARG